MEFQLPKLLFFLITPNYFGYLLKLDFKVIPTPCFGFFGLWLRLLHLVTGGRRQVTCDI